jgi:hypothetical protein
MWSGSSLAPTGCLYSETYNQLNAYFATRNRRSRSCRSRIVCLPAGSGKQRPNGGDSSALATCDRLGRPARRTGTGSGAQSRQHVSRPRARPDVWGCSFFDTCTGPHNEATATGTRSCEWTSLASLAKLAYFAAWNSLLRAQFICFVQQLPESFEEIASFRQACAVLKLFGQFIQLHGDLLKCHRELNNDPRSNEGIRYLKPCTTKVPLVRSRLSLVFRSNELRDQHRAPKGGEVALSY